MLRTTDVLIRNRNDVSVLSLDSRLLPLGAAPSRRLRQTPSNGLLFKYIKKCS